MAYDRLLVDIEVARSRVKAACKEVGIPEQSIDWHEGPFYAHWGVRSDVSVEQAWRLRETVMAAQPMCFKHFDMFFLDSSTWDILLCGATEYFEKDCGQ